MYLSYLRVGLIWLITSTHGFSRQWWISLWLCDVECRTHYCPMVIRIPTAETTMHPAGTHSGEQDLTRQKKLDNRISSSTW